MIRKVLVYENALADKHPALERALQLARGNKLQLKIVDVVDGPSGALRDLHRQVRTLIDQERKNRLDAMCQPMRDRDIEFTAELIRGRPFVEIVREVVHDGFHLVIKTAASTQPAAVMGIMGPTDMRLVRNCPCPVWLEVPGRDVGCERILVAVDPLADDDGLNNALLKMGDSLAKASGGELHVVSTWDIPEEDFLAEKMKPEKLARFVDDVQSAAQRRLDALLVGAGKPAGPNQVVFRKGNPAKTILDCAESLRPDVLVIGTVGHTDVRGLLIGNTAYTVLQQINCSVLTVKPESLFRV